MNNKNISLRYIPFDLIPIPGQLYRINSDQLGPPSESEFVALGTLDKGRNKKYPKILGLLRKSDEKDKSGLYVCIGRVKVQGFTPSEKLSFVHGELIEDVERREIDYITAKHTIRDLLSISHLLHARINEKELRNLDPKSLSWLLSATDALSPTERAESFNTRSISKRLRIFSQAIKNAVRQTKSPLIAHLCN